MNNDNLRVLILAAGLGKRMHSELPKGLNAAAGRTMLQCVIDAARTVSDDIVCVLGHGRDRVAELLHKIYGRAVSENIFDRVEFCCGGGIDFVFQDEQRGTGHAAKMAEHLLTEGDVLVLFADTPLITPQLLKDLVAEHRGSENSATLVTAFVEQPGSLGRVVRRNGAFEKIVEYKNASAEQLQIKEINSGIAVFNAALLRSKLVVLTDDNPQGEYLLTDVFEMLLSEGRRVGAVVADDPNDVIGVNDQYMLSMAEQVLLARKRRELMLSGVVMHMPETIYIESGVVVDAGAVIEQGSRLMGSTEVRHGAVIGPYTELKNVVVGEGAVLDRTVAIDSVIGEKCKIGPFAYIRPDCELSEGVKVGDFVELKNARIGAGSKVPHLSYIGDGEIGERTNIGCGTIFVNYDGEHKHRTRVGSDAFVGCNSNLVAPVSVGNDTFVAAGTTVTRDVADGEFVISRVPQSTRPNNRKKKK